MIREFASDGCIDLAAGLSYQTVFSIFPGLIALVSILNLFGQGDHTVVTILDEAQGVVPEDTWNTIRPALEAVLPTQLQGSDC